MNVRVRSRHNGHTGSADSFGGGFVQKLSPPGGNNEACNPCFETFISKKPTATHCVSWFLAPRKL